MWHIGKSAIVAIRAVAMVLAGWVIGVATAVGIASALKACDPSGSASGIKEKFDELEFVVVHRPHVTYFVDMKYFMCFATRKPNYQDLVFFHCPERLWREVADKRKRPKDAGVTQDARQ